jgi:hypothetical protein
LCDKVFLDPPPPDPFDVNQWIPLGTLMDSVKFYGVLDDSDAPTMKATLWMSNDQNVPAIIEGGKLHALG